MRRAVRSGRNASDCLGAMGAVETGAGAGGATTADQKVVESLLKTPWVVRGFEGAAAGVWLGGGLVGCWSSNNGG